MQIGKKVTINFDKHNYVVELTRKVVYMDAAINTASNGAIQQECRKIIDHNETVMITILVSAVNCQRNIDNICDSKYLLCSDDNIAILPQH